ncbi:hypothetical protein Glove_139g113 [Diversispora epigaea]|uniref:non-specific serine/threonine protein kinase n=1 Tax=Diversispora epigaea TaxID=1348612 RepID=A0A397IVX5_9GLOM|nr:hypothetical protein Glove_139g113 [Diversispora epigaea]
MSQTKYCPNGHSSNDIGYRNKKNTIYSYGYCDLCTIDHFTQEFPTWSSGNTDIDRIIKECQIHYGYSLQWVSYDNFRDIEFIAEGGYGSVHSTLLEKGVKRYWDLNKSEWDYSNVGDKVALKEIKDSKDDVSKFLKEVQNIQLVSDLLYITICLGISKNPKTQNYIIVMELYDATGGLNNLHTKNLAHCDLHAGNILVKSYTNYITSNNTTLADFGSCSLENDLLLNPDGQSKSIYGSIPYIPPEVLRGNPFTKKGDIYSLGGIMYEIATGKQPFYDRAHGTTLMIKIWNGLRPTIPPNIENCIPKHYKDLMYRCWSADPSKRPTAEEVYDEVWSLYEILLNKKVEDNIFKQFKIADKNKEKAIKSQKLEISQNAPHLQSCYISRNISTLYALNDLLDDIRSGRSKDPNLLMPPSTYGTYSSNSNSFKPTYDIDSKEYQECIDWEKEIQNHNKTTETQNHAKERSTTDIDSKEYQECIDFEKEIQIKNRAKKRPFTFENEDNIMFKKIKA